MWALELRKEMHDFKAKGEAGDNKCRGLPEDLNKTIYRMRPFDRCVLLHEL